MSSLPNYRPALRSLSPLGSEILDLLWAGEPMTVRNIHEKIFGDPACELAYASVTTVLNRLVKNGWVKSDRQKQVLKTHDPIQNFWAMGQPDVIATFADEADEASLDQLEAIALQINAARDARTQS